MFNLTYKMKNKLLIVLVFGLIAVLFAKGLQLNLTSRITDRIKFHAIPIAISQLYHHHPHDYTGIKAIEVPFQSPTDVEILIKNAIAQDVQGNQENYYWVADDKGFSDYVIASFYLFGPHLKSMYYMWFVILSASVIFFLMAFHKKNWMLGFLCLLLLGMHVALSTLALSSTHSLSFAWRNSLSSVSLYEPRFLDVLALIAVFHMLILASKATAFKWLRDGVPLMGQIVIFIFLYHSRSSLGWELFAIFFYCIWRFFTVVFAEKDQKKMVYCTNSTLIVAVALCGSLFLLNVYKHVAYNPLYFAKMGQRTFWHNALMGLGSEPLLADKYKINADDFNIAKSVILFSKKSNLCSADVSALDPQQLLNSLGNWGVVNWVDYEKCSKKLFFKIVMTNKLSVVRLYIITKPANALNVLRIAGGKTSEPALEEIRSKYGMRWSPFNIIHTGFLIIIFSLSFKSLRRVRKQCMRMIAIVFVASFIPSVSFYPDILTEGGVLAILPMILYSSLVFIINSMQKMSIFAHIGVLKRTHE